MQNEDFFYFIDHNLNIEESSTDIKSFITRDNGEEEFNEEAGGTEEPECNVSNYLEVVNQIKQLSVFTFQKGDVDGFKLLKTSEIYFVKICSNNKNIKQINMQQFINIKLYIVSNSLVLHML